MRAYTVPNTIEIKIRERCSECYAGVSVRTSFKTGKTFGRKCTYCLGTGYRESFVPLDELSQLKEG